MQETMSHTAAPAPVDKIERALRGTAQNIIAVVFGLLPLFFIPISYAPFGYSKTFFVIVGVFVALIFFSLSVLRSGSLKLMAPAALFGLWGIAATSAVSGLLSGDIRDAFLGDVLGVHTTVFVVLLALVATVMAVLGQSKGSIMRLYFVLTGSTVVLTVYHVLRLFVGPEFLSFGVFTGAVSSPAGGWNDLGLLFGLIILLALVALEQLPLTTWGRAFFSGVVALALVMLAVVNFSAVWIVLALVSLVVLMYSLTRDRFVQSSALTPTSASGVSIQSILLSASVFVVSLLFIIGGSAVGTLVSNVTNISYVEVRPSFTATADIARNVYAENAFVGIGPNKFADAWRLYKDQAINQTIFWDTNFTSGSGYIPTAVVTTGIFGALAWLLFVVLFLRAGFKMLIQSQAGDRFWYFIGSSSFVAAVYLWGMSFIYVPGPTILLLAGIFTSIAFTAYAALVPVRHINFSVATNRRSGIVLVGIVMVVIVASASALYYAGRHYAATYTFNQAVGTIAAGTDIEAVERQIADAYATSQNDVYAFQIAQYQLAKLNALLGLSEPTTAQQQQFQQAAANGINAAQLAVTNDPSEPRNYAILASLYSILATAGVEGAQERAQESLSSARTYDPRNPSYALLEAQLLSRTGDLEGARGATIEAIQLKNNYDEALFFLTQLEIAAGNVSEAIAATQAMVSLEPSNPGRHYQLGILEINNSNIPAAIASLERAVALDANYANARYFLALAYAEEGRTEEAVAQLAVVRDLNPDNAGVADLISQLEAGTFATGAIASDEQVAEPATVDDSGEAVTTTEEPDTSLVTPVNVVPETESTETPTEDSAPAEESTAPESTEAENTVQ